MAFQAAYGFATLGGEADEIKFGPIVELARPTAWALAMAGELKNFAKHTVRDDGRYLSHGAKIPRLARLLKKGVLYSAGLYSATEPAFEGTLKGEVWRKPCKIPAARYGRRCRSGLKPGE